VLLKRSHASSVSGWYPDCEFGWVARRGAET
jgi:hypothetical protein